MSYFGSPSYGITATIDGLSVPDAIERTKEALASEGFGVITSIDIEDTLRKKLDMDYRPYVILGACNPHLAHKALGVEPPIGLLLPCNVVVTEDENGNAIVSALDPTKVFEIIGRPEVLPMAENVKMSLIKVIERVSKVNTLMPG